MTAAVYKHSVRALQEGLRSVKPSSTAIMTVRAACLELLKHDDVDAVVQGVQQAVSAARGSGGVDWNFSNGQHKLALVYVLDALCVRSLAKGEPNLAEQQAQLCSKFAPLLESVIQSLVTPSNVEKIDEALKGWSRAARKFHPTYVEAARAALQRCHELRAQVLQQRAKGWVVPCASGGSSQVEIQEFYGSFADDGNSVKVHLPSGNRLRLKSQIKRLPFCSYLLEQPLGRFDASCVDDPATAATAWADGEEIAARKHAAALPRGTPVEPLPVPTVALGAGGSLPGTATNAHAHNQTLPVAAGPLTGDAMQFHAAWQGDSGAAGGGAGSMSAVSLPGMSGVTPSLMPAGTDGSCLMGASETSARTFNNSYADYGHGAYMCPPGWFPEEEYYQPPLPSGDPPPLSEPYEPAPPVGAEPPAFVPPLPDEPPPLPDEPYGSVVGAQSQSPPLPPPEPQLMSAPAPLPLPHNAMVNMQPPGYGAPDVRDGPNQAAWPEVARAAPPPLAPPEGLPPLPFPSSSVAPLQFSAAALTQQLPSSGPPLPTPPPLTVSIQQPAQLQAQQTLSTPSTPTVSMPSMIQPPGPPGPPAQGPPSGYTTLHAWQSQYQQPQKYPQHLQHVHNAQHARPPVAHHMQPAQHMQQGQQVQPLQHPPPAVPVAAHVQMPPPPRLSPRGPHVDAPGPPASGVGAAYPAPHGYLQTPRPALGTYGNSVAYAAPPPPNPHVHAASAPAMHRLRTDPSQPVAPGEHSLPGPSPQQLTRPPTHHAVDQYRSGYGVQNAGAGAGRGGPMAWPPAVPSMGMQRVAGGPVPRGQAGPMPYMPYPPGGLMPPPGRPRGMMQNGSYGRGHRQEGHGRRSGRSDRHRGRT